MLDLRQRGSLAVQVYDYTVVHEMILAEEYALETDLLNALSKIGSENRAVPLIKKELKESRQRRSGADDHYWHRIKCLRRECLKQEWDEAVLIANDIAMKYNHFEISPFERLENIHRENSVFTAEQEEAFKVLLG